MLTLASIVVALLAGLAVYRDTFGMSSLDACRMTYMYPDYLPVPVASRVSKYALFEYKEGFEHREAEHLIPVLFIPGNAGSYKQARSVGSVSNQYASPLRAMRVYTVDTIDELSALDASLIIDQALFANDAIRTILGLHPSAKSVVILAHSMGGIVAKSLFSLDNYVNGSVESIITLATPHAYPPIAVESNMAMLYTHLDRFWRKQFAREIYGEKHPDFERLLLVSIASGERDSMVLSSLSGVDHIIPESHGFTAFSTGSPAVWISADHRCILWCNQLVHTIARALYGTVHTRNPGASVDLDTRLDVWKRLLTYEFNPSKLSAHSSQISVERGTPIFWPDASEPFILSGEAVKPGLHVLDLQPGKTFQLYSSSNVELEIFACKSRATSLDDLQKSGSCLSIKDALFAIPSQTPSRKDGSADVTANILTIEEKLLSPYASVVIRVLNGGSSNSVLGVQFNPAEASISVQRYLADVVLGSTFQVSLPSIASVLSFPTITESFLAYKLQVKTSCDPGPLLDPVVHMSVTGSPETRWLFPWPKEDSLQISFYANTPKGLQLRLFRNPMIASKCGSEVTLRLSIDYLKTFGIVSRRGVNLIIVLTGALACVLFVLTTLGRTDTNVMGQMRLCFTAGLFAILMRQVSRLADLSGGEDSLLGSTVSLLICYPIAFAILLVLHVVTTILVNIGNVSCKFLPKFIHMLSTDETLFPIVCLTLVLQLNVFVSPATVPATVLLLDWHVLNCVQQRLRNTGKQCSWLLNAMHATLLQQILVTALTAPKLVTSINNMRVGWIHTRPSDIGSVGSQKIEFLLTAIFPLLWLHVLLRSLPRGDGKKVGGVQRGFELSFTIISGLIGLIVVLSEGPRDTHMLLVCCGAASGIVSGALLMLNRGTASVDEKKLE
ncbi:PGAP1-like protein-domain-containing protein [Chytriomyces cf. hyalinus JEL632]|nr:PGAP1-like protein-domain-containing protein [Chytriomyces cf. hyalinus JEL632]